MPNGAGELRHDVADSILPLRSTDQPFTNAIDLVAPRNHRPVRHQWIDQLVFCCGRPDFLLRGSSARDGSLPEAMDRKAGSGYDRSLLACSRMRESFFDTALWLA